MSDATFLLKNLPFAIERDIAWRINVRLHRRPSSAPFLSSDTYRAMAHLVIEEDDELCRIAPESQKIVSCVSGIAADRVAQIRLPESFVLLVHQGDNPIGTEFVRQLDKSNCVHCFAQNCVVTDPRITPLPIGLEDQWRHHHGHVRDFVRIRAKMPEKQPGIAWGFTLATNPDERWLCYRAMIRNKQAVSVPLGVNSRLYKKFVSNYMFIASPPGNGVDCHRTWEALYLRIVPIVKRSILMEHFKSIGLPLLLVDDWREVDSWGEDYLVDIYNRLAPSFDSEALWLPYWEYQIDNYLAKSPRTA